MEFAHPYFGAFIFFVLTFGAFIGTTVLARFISRRMAKLDGEKLKLTIYECGPEVTKQPNKISSHFYLFALLFILFDVEIIFIALLTIGFVYAWKKGALEWHSIK
jgi:NADH-quinone oxidoreductase subunit A